MDERRERDRPSAQDQRVCRVESTVVDEQTAKTRVLSLVGPTADNPENGTTIALTDQNGLPTLELRLASRTGEVYEKMCAAVEEIGEEARRATPMYVPKGPSDAERRAHEIHHMP